MGYKGNLWREKNCKKYGLHLNNLLEKKYTFKKVVDIEYHFVIQALERGCVA